MLMFFVGIFMHNFVRASQCVAIGQSALQHFDIDVTALNQKLLHAAQKDNIETIKLLFNSEVKPDINARDESGKTAFMIAAHKLDANMVQWLWEHGANRFIKDDQEYTALMEAIDVDTTSCFEAKKKHADQMLIMRWILNSSRDNRDAEKQTKTGITALMLAVLRNNEDAINRLLENRPDLNIQDMYGTTALMIAVNENNLPILSILLDTGARTDLKDSTGKTAIDYAENNPEMLARFFPSRNISPALQRLRAPIYAYRGAGNELENINPPTSSQAQLELGIMYKMGQGVRQSHEQALKYFEHVTKQTSDLRAQAQAWYELGDMFLNGQDVQKDDQLALKYFTRASHLAAHPQIQAAAYMRVGEILDQEGPLQDKERARINFEHAAAHSGNLLERARASAMLGDIYYLGLDVPQDYEKAKKYFKRAAVQTHDVELQKRAQARLQEIDALLEKNSRASKSV